MKQSMKQTTTGFALFVLVVVAAASRSAQAANLIVNCDRKETIHQAIKLLADTNPQGPNTILVVGSCRENLSIRSIDRLTVITRRAASITGRSGGNLPVVDIEDSRGVTVQGLTISGGDGGVLCSSASVCYLTGNTIQDSAGAGLETRGGSHAFLESNVVQNNGFRGATVTDGSQMFSSNDLFQGNAAQGIAATFGAYVQISNSSFLNNGVGLEASLSTLRLIGGTISGSGGDGMILLGGGSAVFQGPTITGNGGNGVHLEDGAFAGFLAANITGNLSGTDIDCAPQFPITRFIERTGGITNCVEPSGKSQMKTME